jgi:protocatechuate 3,4-dioxygenase beta subunit
MALKQKTLTRRAALEMLGALGAVAVTGCSSTDTTSGTGGAGGSGGAGGATSTATTTTTATASTSTGSSAAWATGDGTFLTGKDYGNPFSSGVGTTCTVYKDVTKGPCRSNTYDRQDMTAGVAGLPTRLEIVVVDSACKPIPDAVVEVWHCSPLGVYSAAKVAETASPIGYDSSNFGDLNEQFCTGGDTAGEEHDWFRAYQKAGADGRVTFDTVFPGWYKGRTIHVHFMVTVGTQTYLTSQFFFDDTLNDEILADHATYSVNGAKDTTNAGDMVASGLTLSDAVMSTAKQSDGALLAWKAITISA